MKVLFQCRPNLYQLSGGDKIQILKTKEFLEKTGIEVEISTVQRPDLNGVDIFHLFNPSLLSLQPIVDCKKKGIPVAISTIHWDMKEYYESMFAVNKEYFRLKPDGFVRHYLRNQAFALFYRYWWYGKSMRNLKKILEFGDILLPNSRAEENLLKRQFNLNDKKFFIIPNGIDSNISYSPDSFYQKHKVKNFILCAARLEYRKNQFRFIQSMMRNNLPIIFIGNNKFNKGYTALCKKLADKRGNVLFIDHISQEELFSAYSNARVHVLPSWYETPGLSSLEAGMTGCNIVVSDRGSTREYFENFAEYCDPANVDSISRAVVAAYNKDKNTQLQNRILNSFTWQNTAKTTLAAYRSILGKP